MKRIIKKIWCSSPKAWLSKLKSLAMIFKDKKKKVHQVNNSGNIFFLLMPTIIPDSYQDMLTGSYEKDTIEKILKEKINKIIIWDIGAHIGYYSLLFASNINNQSRILCFEPNPNNTEWLESNLKLNTKYSSMITLYQKALSDKKQEINFNIGNKDDATSSGGYIDNITPPLPDSSYSNFKKIKMVTSTIDELVFEEGLEIPNILKIDTEGAELKILEGGINTIEKYKPELIIEVHTIPLMFYITNFLNKINYSIEILDEENNNINTKIIYARSQ